MINVNMVFSEQLFSPQVFYLSYSVLTSVKLLIDRNSVVKVHIVIDKTNSCLKAQKMFHQPMYLPECKIKIRIDLKTTFANLCVRSTKSAPTAKTNMPNTL